MHRAELILNHATSLAEQRRGGAVTDHFPGWMSTRKPSSNDQEKEEVSIVQRVGTNDPSHHQALRALKPDKHTLE